MSHNHGDVVGLSAEVLFLVLSVVNCRLSVWRKVILLVRHNLCVGADAVRDTLEVAKVPAFQDIGADAACNLLFVEVVENTVGCKHDDVIVAQFVTVVFGVIGKVAVGAALVWEVKAIGLEIRHVELLEVFLLLAENHVAAVTKVARVHLAWSLGVQLD